MFYMKSRNGHGSHFEENQTKPSQWFKKIGPNYLWFRTNRTKQEFMVRLTVLLFCGPNQIVFSLFIFLNWNCAIDIKILYELYLNYD